MTVCDRIKAIRESKNLSQGDIEKRTGLLRCYVSRVENGHTVPAVETLEKFARALEVETYQLFLDVNHTPKEVAGLPEVKVQKMSTSERHHTAEIAKLYSRIKSPKHRTLARLMLRQFAKASG